MRIAPFLLVAASLLSACRPNNSSEQPLLVDVANKQSASALVHASISSGLTALDKTGRVIPGLAQSWRVSDDGLSIVFRLRPANFANGLRVTGRDVVRAIDRARNDRKNSPHYELLAGITSATAPLESVVEIRLSTPQPEILELLATAPLGVRWRGRITAGPYLLSPEEPVAVPGMNPPMHVIPNKEHFSYEAQRPYAAMITPVPIERAIARFNRGESEIVLGDGLDGFASARVTAKRNTLQLELRRATLLLLVNYKTPSLSRLEARRALQMAINREALGPAFFGTAAARPVRLLSPANISGYSPAEPDWAAQPYISRQEEARRLLAEAGHDSLISRLQLTVAVTDSVSDTRLMEAIAGDFAAIGVDIKLARRSADAHSKAIQDGDFDLALINRQTPVDSPLPFLFPNLCSRNTQGVCIPEADRLFNESWKAPTRAKRLAALAQAERIWAEDGVAIGIIQPLGWSLVSPRIVGFQPNAAGAHPLHLLSRNTSLMPIR